MDEPVPSVADIIQMREWKHALFTTYTLSLSYFESEILPSLIRSGCSDIWLVADAEGYRSSLLERRSMRVGHEYRLIPAALPHGVFHAKSIYLSGDEGDLLIIGSGNVTFAGHGRNLEVFEALVPEADGLAFADFASYLEAMRERADISFARTDWIDEFAARATMAADDHGASRLIHSLTVPVLDRIPGALADYGSCSSVTVISPYHDPDGIAVRRLSEELGSVPVAVAIGNEDTSPFPFEAASAWEFPVRPVRPVHKDKRFVHAKLYDFVCANQHVLLTGSINATRKALATTDNVELGVLRAAPSDSPLLEWEDASAPVFEARARAPSGLKENEIVYAAFDRDEPKRLSGKIISLQPVAGAWRGLVMQADGDTYAFDVEVDEQGQFAYAAQGLEAYSEMPALQILLTCSDREARGWIHNEMFLSMSGRRRLTAGSLSRLMRREGSDDDIEALLDYLSMHANSHLRIFDLPVRSDEDDDGRSGSASDVVSVNLEELAPTDTVLSGSTSTGVVADRQIDAFDRAMQRLRKVFLGHGRNRTMAASALGNSVVAEEDIGEFGAESAAAKPELERRGLAEFESRIEKLIADAKDNAASVRAVLVLKLEIGMWMRIYRLNDLDDAHGFLKSWFYQACRLAEPDVEKVVSFEQHVVTNAAIIFALTAEQDRKAIALSLHDSLEHIYRGDIDRYRLRGAHLAQSDAGFAPFLLGEKVTDEGLANALEEIISYPTSRQQLIRALDLAEEGKPIPSDWGVFQSNPGAELYEALSKPKWKRKVRALKSHSPACAFDYYSFSKDAAFKYKRYRIGQCIHCNRFTLDISP